MFALSSTQASSSDRVQTAIRGAADATGTSFDYLMKTAARESSLDPTARAKGSSATGLYQFIDSTWMQMVKEAGPSAGLQSYADAIQRTAGGRYVASDASSRQAILALRTDPAVSARMAAAFTQKNTATLSAALGRAPTDGELYVAHFMGAGGASSLIRLAATDPNAVAADAFPKQAAANPSVFYNRNGSARSVSEVYGLLVKRFDSGTHAPVSVVATAAATQAATPAASGGDADAGAADSGTNAWLAIPASNAYGVAASERTPFAGLFRTDGAGPISAYVAATWSSLGPEASATAAGGASPSPAPVQRRPGIAADADLIPVRPLTPSQDDADATGSDDGFFSRLGGFLGSVFAAPATDGSRTGQSERS